MSLITSIKWRNVATAVVEKAERLKMFQRILIFVLTLGLLGGGFFSLFYLPKTTAIAQTNEEISNLERRLAVAKRKAKNLAKLEAEHREVAAQLKEAIELLPDKREIPSLLRNITTLGKESRLEFPLFTPQGERPQDFYVEIPVNIVLSGKYNDVASFFDKVGRMDRIVNIHGISMKPEKEMSTTLVTKCTAVTYRFKSEAERKAEEAKKKKKGK
jgi:type IV pilus assembly protein PilO